MVSPKTGDPAHVTGATAIVHFPDADLRLPIPVRESAAMDHPGQSYPATLAAAEIMREPLQPARRPLLAAATFLVAYLGGLVLLNEYHSWMDRRVGPVTFGYLFALAQFFMAWIAVALFLRAANIFEPAAVLEDTDEP